MKPITPQELRKSITGHPTVVQAINELMTESGKANHIKIFQKDIVERIGKLDETMTSRYIFQHNLLDIEDVYRENGWKVEYDKPGYNESYEPYFLFTVPR